MAELVGEKTDKKTTAGKDLYKTPDGDLVSEKSVTFKLFGMYVNAPSIINYKNFFDDIVMLSRFTIIFLPFISMTAFFGAMLNASGRFFYFALHRLFLIYVLLFPAFI